MSRAPKASRAKRPLTPAQREALEKAHAARRRKVEAGQPAPAGAPTTPAQGPSFMDPPPPEARDDKAPANSALRLAAENEIAGSYAGIHFLAAWATGIEQLTVEEQQAREIAKRFVGVLEAWGIELDDLAKGRLLVTLNFAILFGGIELSKLAILRQVMAQRSAQQQPRATSEPEPVAGDNGPAPGVFTGPDAMTGFREAAE